VQEWHERSHGLLQDLDDGRFFLLGWARAKAVALVHHEPTLVARPVLTLRVGKEMTPVAAD
jgi:hypothetical protein